MIQPAHPLPQKTEMWGYDHVPKTWRKADPQFTAMTAPANVTCGLVRLVAGYENGTFSRGPDSVISLDTISVGIAHWWAGTIPSLLSGICRAHPDLAAWAFGAEVAQKATSKAWLESVLGDDRGKGPLRPEVEWLAAGWYEIARHPRWVHAQVQAWLDKYVGAASQECAKHGWDSALALAACARLRNSGELGLVDDAIERLKTRDPMQVLAYVYNAPESQGGYDHPERWQKLTTWPHFKGKMPSRVSADDLDYRPEVRRVDGSQPRWVLQGGVDGSPPPMSVGASGNASRMRAWLLRGAGLSGAAWLLWRWFR